MTVFERLPEGLLPQVDLFLLGFSAGFTFPSGLRKIAGSDAALGFCGFRVFNTLDAA